MAINGSIKTKLPTWQDILKHTGGGYAVFSAEIPGLTLGKSFCSPIRRDKRPSCSLSCKSGVWFLRDFSQGTSITALQLVEKKYNLSFIDAINKMAQEYGLMELRNKEYSIQPLSPAPIYEEDDIQCSFTYGKWRKEHYKFWENTNVSREHCEKYNTYAVKDLSWNRRKMHIKDKEVVWCYFAEDIQKVKLYFPERQKTENERFKTNIRGSYIWGLSTLQKCSKLIVHKSMKDLLVSSVIFPCNIATQNESSKIFDDFLVGELEGVAEKIYICYGSDDQGTQESIQITKDHKWLWVNTPKQYLPEINDLYGLAKAKGIQEVEKLYKQKRIL